MKRRKERGKQRKERDEEGKREETKEGGKEKEGKEEGRSGNNNSTMELYKIFVMNFYLF